MKIYKNLTYKINNIDQALKIIKNKKEENINILYAFEALQWQGAEIVKTLEKKIKQPNVNFIVEARDDLSAILMLIEVGIKDISVSIKLNEITLNKIKSIAKKSKVNILVAENFKEVR